MATHDFTHLDPLPEVHPRHDLVERARRELGDFVLEWRKRHDLTLCEELALITEELHNRLAGTVRAERRRAEENARVKAPLPP